MTTEETKSGTDDLSVAMTATLNDDVTQTTEGTSAAPLSTSRDVQFYFTCAVVVIGVIGTITNGLILYALMASKQHKKKILIFNQNALDCFSSFWLVITYSVKICNIHLSGMCGYWLCLLILSEYFVWMGYFASKLSLVVVTVERYLKVVHTGLNKKVLRPWVVHTMAALPWVFSCVYTGAVFFPTTAVVNGFCYAVAFWSSHATLVAYTLCNFVAFFMSILVIIVCCYARILAVIRRQARVMAAHSQASGSNTVQNRTNQKIQSNVIKTMIIVSAFFAVSNLPAEVSFVIMNVSQQFYDDFTFYYATIFIMYLNICVNPFIYAIKFNPVKRVLIGLNPCGRNPEQIV